MGTMADKCDKCGLSVFKHRPDDSSDMVVTCDSFVYMCDLKEGEACRPFLQLKVYQGVGERQSKTYCLDCLDTTVHEWVVEMKKRGKSESIPLNHIRPPGKTAHTPRLARGR